MTSKQKSALIGMILGDVYLQKTGKYNARIRFEHSINQKEYLEWKVSLFKDYFQGKIQILDRFHAKWDNTYTYVRAQSYSSPEFGKFQRVFYKDSKKIIPSSFKMLFKRSLSLAIWFMDDGYYYPRDKMSYIYIPNYDEESILNLTSSLKENFNLIPSLKLKKKGLVLSFNVSETKKLMQLIQKHVVASMNYKLAS